jgi:hypothetical protein
MGHGVGTPSAADLTSKVKARLGSGRFGRTITVSFIARVPVTDASAAYLLQLRASGPQVNCRSTLIGPLLRNVHRGQGVTLHEPTNGCRGIFHGTVAYRYGLNGTQLPFVLGTGHELTVGTFTIDAR